MQRLLRGKLLYLLLGAIAFLLYMPMIHVELRMRKQTTVAQPPAEQTAAPGADAQAWSQSLDMQAIQKLFYRNPLLGLAAWLLSLLTSLMVLAGLGLSLHGFLTGGARRFWRFDSPRLPHWSLKEAGRIVLLLALMASLMPFGRLALMSYDPHWEIDPQLWIPVSMTVLDVFLILAILAFAEGKRPASAWQSIGFDSRRSWQSLRLGLRTYVTAFPWLFLLLAAVIELAAFFNIKPPVEPIHELIFNEHRRWVFLVTTVLACLIGPLAEECFFRGVLYPALRAKMSRLTAMLASSMLFAGIHTNIIGFIPIMALGCLLAYVYERSGSLMGSFAVHALHNSLLMAIAILMRAAMAS